MSIIEKVKRKGISTSVIYLINSLIYKITKIPYKFILDRLSVKENYIVFTSLPDFSDNSKILYDYMLENCKDKNYKYIWLVKKIDKNIQKSTNNTTIFIKNVSKFHKGQTLRALFYTSIAKMIFFTHGSPKENLKIKKEQIVINLWHGCGYKSVEKNKTSYIERNYFDYALVPGNIFIDNKAVFWGCDKNQILNIGYPRYDLLFKENDKTREYVEKLRNGNNKIIIWMPTFRKTEFGVYPEEKINDSFELPILNSENDLILLNSICKENSAILCIKKHPYQIEYKSSKLELSNIIFIDNDDLVENNIDLYSLMKYTDGLITDYSSIAIDYILIDKAIGFTLDDFENYSKTRGFAFENPKEYMPGYHIYNFEEFKSCLYDISRGNDVYKQNREKIINEVHNKCDNYCRRIYNKITEIMGERK